MAGASRVSVVFTADSTGKSITLKGAGPATSQEIVDETAGTITFIETVAGVPELVKVTNGRVVAEIRHDVVEYLGVPGRAAPRSGERLRALL
jgi:hypothetical protein